MKKTEKMFYYKVDELVEAAKSFARKQNASEDLKKSLREIESKKNDIPENDVREVSYDTFCKAIVALTACPGKVIAVILAEFKKLGYQAIEK